MHTILILVGLAFFDAIGVVIEIALVKSLVERVRRVTSKPVPPRKGGDIKKQVFVPDMETGRGVVGDHLTERRAGFGVLLSIKVMAAWFTQQNALLTLVIFVNVSAVLASVLNYTAAFVFELLH